MIINFPSVICRNEHSFTTIGNTQIGSHASSDTILKYWVSWKSSVGQFVRSLHFLVEWCGVLGAIHCRIIPWSQFDSSGIKFFLLITDYSGIKFFLLITDFWEMIRCDLQKSFSLPNSLNKSSAYKARHAHKRLYMVLPKYSGELGFCCITSCRELKYNKQAIELNSLLNKRHAKWWYW